MGKLDLSGKKGLIVGIANKQSIAWGCASIMHETGAELAITYMPGKSESYVVPLAESIDAQIILPCDLQNPDQVEALFQEIEKKWGRLDFLVHSVAFAPKDDLHGRVTDCSLEGFLKAMDISCHSFMRLARKAEPLMADGGSIMTVTYYGSEKVVEHYNIMGPVKAALEASVRYMSAELGKTKIRVNALSPGAIKTRAAGGLEEFDKLLANSEIKSPMHRLVSIEDVGYMATFLASDAAKNITGSIHYIDAGYEVID